MVSIVHFQSGKGEAVDELGHIGGNYRTHHLNGCLTHIERSTQAQILRGEFIQRGQLRARGQATGLDQSPEVVRYPDLERSRVCHIAAHERPQ